MRTSIRTGVSRKRRRNAGTSSTFSTRCAARCISPAIAPKCSTMASRRESTTRSSRGSAPRSRNMVSRSCASSKCAASGRSTKAWPSAAAATSCAAMQIIAKYGLGLPLTAYANDPKQAEEIIRAVNGPPVVIKLLEGTQGIGVVLAETMSRGQVGDRGLSRRQCEYPGAGIHQGSRRHRHPRAGRRRQGGRRDEAHRRTGRFPQQPPPRRQRAAGQDHPRRTLDRGARGAGGWA